MTTLRRELEGTIKAKVIRDALVKWGVLTIRLDYEGWPDCLFLTPGQPLFMELKRAGEVPRPLQEHRLQQLRDLGYQVHWADNYEDAIAAIRRML